MPFSASAFSRNRGLGTGPAEFGAPEGPKAQGQGQQQQQAATQGGAESNPLMRLTEDQREEINEAVRFSFPWEGRWSLLWAGSGRYMVGD